MCDRLHGIKKRIQDVRNQTMTQETSTGQATASNDTAQFAIIEELSTYEESRPWAQGHFAKTLFKRPDFRILLVSMDRGSKLHEHHADGTISVHVLKGALRVRVSGQVRDIAVSSILAIGSTLEHDVEALEDSAFLLTMSWPDAETLDRLRKTEHTDQGNHGVSGAPFN
jgi:quercetin dioxygenase-like cupin family protein